MDTVLRDLDDFVTFSAFPADHWTHLKTTNPIESVFAGVRLRTDAAKRMRKRENALYLVYKIVRRLSFSWPGTERRAQPDGDGRRRPSFQRRSAAGIGLTRGGDDRSKMSKVRKDTPHLLTMLKTHDRVATRCDCAGLLQSTPREPA